MHFIQNGNKISKFAFFLDRKKTFLLKTKVIAEFAERNISKCQTVQNMFSFFKKLTAFNIKFIT